MARRPAAGAEPGRAVLRRVLRDLEHGWPAGLTVLTGDDLYHLDAAQRGLLERLVGDAPGHALTIFGEQRVDVGTVVGAARSAAMFAPRRVVLVRDVASLEGEPEGLLEYAGAPPPDSYLIVHAPALDRRRKLHQALAGAGRLLAFAAPTAPSSAEVLELARGRSLELDAGAAAFLAEACAGDLYRVEGELDKLREWLGGEGPHRVGLEQVRQIAAGAGLLSGWEVADAVLGRDPAAALAALRRLLLLGGTEPLQLLGGLAFRARAMLQAKALLERRVPPAQAFRAARLWGVAERRIVEGLARYSLAELLRFPSLLLEADRTLKSRSVEPHVVLEVLVERMTEANSPARVAAAGR